MGHLQRECPQNKPINRTHDLNKKGSGGRAGHPRSKTLNGPGAETVCSVGPSHLRKKKQSRRRRIRKKSVANSYYSKSDSGTQTDDTTSEDVILSENEEK